MDRAGDELLARPGLPRDEHGGVGRSHFGNPRQDRPQRVGGADNFLEHRGTVDLVAQHQIFAIELVLETL